MKAKQLNLWESTPELKRVKEATELINKSGSSTLVMFQENGFLRAYGFSAVVIAEIAGTPIEAKGGTRTTEFPEHCGDTYFPKIIKEGYKIAIPNYQ